MTHGEGGGVGGMCARDTSEEGEVVKRFKVQVSECAEVLVGQQEEAVEEEEAHFKAGRRNEVAESDGRRAKALSSALPRLISAAMSRADTSPSGRCEATPSEILEGGGRLSSLQVQPARPSGRRRSRVGAVGGWGDLGRSGGIWYFKWR